MVQGKGFAHLRFSVYVILLVGITTIIALALHSDLPKTFLPRKIGMGGDLKLIRTHVALDSVVCISSLACAAMVFYLVKKKREIYFRGILFAFACFLTCIGLGRVVAIIDIWITFYWIEAIIKAMTAVCGLTLLLTFPVTLKAILLMKSPEEYRKMIEEAQALRKELNELKEWRQQQ